LAVISKQGQDRAVELQIRRGLQGATLSFELEGAVLFGSAARGEAGLESDIDLLVVGRAIPGQRHRRSREIAEIKRLFPGVSLDVLLMTWDEVQSNFRNHNPLFLDIAEEGVVLIDSGGALRDAIEATRLYVRERGIERLDGGWRFPVARGAPTYLSKVANSDFARAMPADARRDHRIGQLLLEGVFFDKAVYHFQQAVEKSVKSILIAVGVFRRTHMVGSALRGVCAEERVLTEWKSRLLRAAENSEELEADLSLSRYPAIVNDALWLPVHEYTLEDARAAEIKSEETLGIAEEFVREWFSGPSASA